MIKIHEPLCKFHDALLNHPLMPLKIDLFSIIILLGLAQGLFLAYYFGSRKVKNGQNSEFWLILLLLCFALNLFEILMCHSNLAFQHLWVVDVAEPALLALTPLYYLYLISKVQKINTSKALRHLLPALVYTLYLAVIFYAQPEQLKLNAYTLAYHPAYDRSPIPDAFPSWVYLWRWNINLVVALQALVYLLLTYQVIHRELKRAKQQWWQVDQPSLKWLRDNLMALLVLLSAFILVKIYFFNDQADYLLASFVSIYIYGISFQLLHHAYLFNGMFSPKTPTFKLPPALIEKINNKFVDIQSREKPFLNPAYSLPQFSRELGLSTNQASQYLNEHVGKSFFEFLAICRINEAKVLLLQEPERKIEDIALQVGYYSKSSFNSSFKKLTNLTPSEYRKNKLKQ